MLIRQPKIRMQHEENPCAVPALGVGNAERAKLIRGI